MQPIYVFPEAFEADEVAAFRDRAEASGFGASAAHYPPRYRNNDRAVIDDRELATRLFSRMQGLLPAELTDDTGARWRLIGLNERFRFCRYRNGQSFTMHRDGVFHRGPGQRSRLTFMIYLNDKNSFEGGATRFFRGRDRSDVALVVEPRRGTLVVFDHALWHEGAPVTKGTKYIMRSDVIYERVEQVGEPIGHRGYVWKLAVTAGGELVSGGRDGTIRVWRTRREALEQAQIIGGHPGSVSALETVGPAIWTATRDGRMLIWRDGTCVRSWQGHGGAVLTLLELVDGRVASSSADGTVIVWSAGGAKETVLRGHRSWVWALSQRSDGVLFSGSEDGDIRAWSPGSGELVDLRGAGQPVRALAALADWRVAAGLEDGTLAVWDAGHRVARVPAHTGPIRAMTELAGGAIATAGEDERVRVWRSSDLAELASHRHADFVTSIAPLGDRFATGSYDASIRLWPVPLQSTRTAGTAENPMPTESESLVPSAPSS